jgi:hypothetical protein
MDPVSEISKTSKSNTSEAGDNTHVIEEGYRSVLSPHERISRGVVSSETPCTANIAITRSPFPARTPELDIQISPREVDLCSVIS